MNVRELRKHADELRFTPQDPVRWLAPRELARTAVKAGLAAVFADYSDKREIQGALESSLLSAPLKNPGAEEIWVDYVSDIGDGFDATSSVAWTLAADELDVGASLPLRRGSLLVLGGDEAYPVASATVYEDRMKGPYRAALPTAEDQPLMVALPGNHDWYDGLTAFLRIFAQGRRIGGWQTRQTRSYFVVQLPQRWWLVGLDSQLGSYFDDPQRRYFESHLSAGLLPGDGVIVCSAEPTWVKSHDEVNAFNALHWFDRNIIRTRLDRETGERVQTGASIRLWLTGDKHHYSRYAERFPGEPFGDHEPLPPDPRRRQMVTCGMGGAFLASTHRLPTSLPLPPSTSRMRQKDDPPSAFARAQHIHPSEQESRSIARCVAKPWSPHWLPRRNRGFALMAGMLHAGLFLLLSFVFALLQGGGSPVAAVRRSGAGDLLWFVGVGLVVVVALLLSRACSLFLTRRRRHPARASALTASLAQIAVALTAMLTTAIPFPRSWPGWGVLLVCLGSAALAGAAVGSELFALWVLRARGGAVAEWAMSAQSIEDHKGFVRMHIAPDGILTLYPLVLERICRDWDLQDVEDHPAARWRRPVPSSRPAARLIEDPVVIARKVRTP
ncbi:hypothetical protein ACH492_33490 [Streptomyces sp. NPDC019443]|uniref:hypothetical protein n=1 Tax=Streptomyces sp. NPDC019443 TaxID=3365061 RepID=UPI00379A5E88